MELRADRRMRCLFQPHRQFIFIPLFKWGEIIKVDAFIIVHSLRRESALDNADPFIIQTGMFLT